MTEETNFQETKDAWARLKRNWNILLCEWLMHKGLKFCPEGYVPSLIQTAFDATVKNISESPRALEREDRE